MGWDGSSGKVIVCDGIDDTTGFTLADKWTFDGVDWQLAPDDCGASPYDEIVYDAALNQVAVLSNIVGVYNSSTVYDSTRDKIVIFGGSNSPPLLFGNAWSYNFDTIYEGSGNTWTQPMPAFGPQPRAYGKAAFDPGRGTMVLFSGALNNNPFLPAFVDTWEWNGSVWSQPQVTGSPPGIDENDMGQLMTYDALEESVLLAAPSGTWRLQWESARLHEVCELGYDVDGDGLAGCADPDCWGFCAPMCPPNAPCAASAPHCGDGTCGAVETCRLCPQDCGACTPVCGDFHCDPGETTISCPGDCP
jgi:hypothetical protein